jgi:hypothetical protein
MVGKSEYRAAMDDVMGISLPGRRHGDTGIPFAGLSNGDTQHPGKFAAVECCDSFPNDIVSTRAGILMSHAWIMGIDRPGIKG